MVILPGEEERFSFIECMKSAGMKTGTSCPVDDQTSYIQSKAMLIYTVRCTIHKPAEARRWLEWLGDGHIADVMAGGAVAAQIVKIDTRGPEEIYEVRYSFRDRAAFDRYERDYAPALRAEGLHLFPSGPDFKHERHTGEVIVQLPATHQ